MNPIFILQQVFNTGRHCLGMGFLGWVSGVVAFVLCSLIHTSTAIPRRKHPNHNYPNILKIRPHQQSLIEEENHESRGQKRSHQEQERFTVSRDHRLFHTLKQRGTLPHSPFSVELVRHQMNSMDARLLLTRIKMRQQMHQQSMQNTSLLETAGVPLKKEVLKEKKLVTYFAHLQVGNGDFRILLDTGSSEFWIPSTQCDTPRCQRHRRYQIPADGNLKVAPNGQMNIEVRHLLTFI